MVLVARVHSADGVILGEGALGVADACVPGTAGADVVFRSRVAGGSAAGSSTCVGTKMRCSSQGIAHHIDTPDPTDTTETGKNSANKTGKGRRGLKVEDILMTTRPDDQKPQGGQADLTTTVGKGYTTHTEMIEVPRAGPTHGQSTERIGA